MLVCKSDLAYVEMRRQFAEHEVVKTYHALVQGNLRENKATIEAPIGRAKVSDFRFCVTPAGKEAVTHWDVMERFGEATLVSVNRAHASDSRAFLIHRASACRRRHVWRQSATERNVGTGTAVVARDATRIPPSANPCLDYGEIALSS